MSMVITQASCERITENVCAVCDVMEMCVSDCTRINQQQQQHRTFTAKWKR